MPSFAKVLLVYCTLYCGGGVPMATLEDSGYLLEPAEGLDEDSRSDEDAEELGCTCRVWSLRSEADLLLTML